jgi:hypothetical protein
MAIPSAILPAKPATKRPLFLSTRLVVYIVSFVVFALTPFLIAWDVGCGSEPYIAIHRDHLADDSERPLFAMTWFQNATMSYFYQVLREGDCLKFRDVHGYAFQGGEKWKLSENGLADLRKQISLLPKSIARPPMESTVVVSFENDGKWCTEVYDSTLLPKPLKSILRIIGERPKIRDRHKDKKN